MVGDGHAVIPNLSACWLQIEMNLIKNTNNLLLNVKPSCFFLVLQKLIRNSQKKDEIKQNDTHSQKILALYALWFYGFIKHLFYCNNDQFV